MKFSRCSDNGTKIEIEVADHSTIDEVLDEFQNFLRGCGYVIEYNVFNICGYGQMKVKIGNYSNRLIVLYSMHAKSSELSSGLFCYVNPLKKVTISST
jgi:hypothetical protein